MGIFYSFVNNKAESDSIKQIEQFKLRIKDKCIVQQNLLVYLGISTDEINRKDKIERNPEELYQFLKNNNISTNKCEFKVFLETISHLWEMHQSKEEMKYKIESLLKILKEDIKSIFSEKEIFQVFRFGRNYFILLILVEQNIISIYTIIKNINNEEYDYCNIIKYFYPEIQKYDEKYLNLKINTDKYFGLKKYFEENQELFYKTRKDRVIKLKVVELIREDKIKEFISFIEHYPIDLKEKIQNEETIFETDTENLTPIECSALFGSVAIFKYFYMKGINININVEKYNNNIIKYAIQGRNYSSS